MIFNEKFIIVFLLAGYFFGYLRAALVEAAQAIKTTIVIRGPLLLLMKIKKMAGKSKVLLA